MSFDLSTDDESISTKIFQKATVYESSDFDTPIPSRRFSPKEDDLQLNYSLSKEPNEEDSDGSEDSWHWCHKNIPGSFIFLLGAFILTISNCWCISSRLLG